MFPLKYFFIVFFLLIIQIIYCQNDTVYIFYDIGVSKLNESNKNKINNIVDKLQKNATYSVETTASADYLGTIKYNKKLAKKRAEIINQFLQNKNEYTFTTFTVKNLGEISDTTTILNLTKGIAAHRKTAVIFKKIETPSIPKEDNSKHKPKSKPKSKSKPKRTKFSEYKDLEIGKNFVIKNLIFKIGTNKLLKKSHSPLIRLARFLNENPTIEIEIIGHLCCNSGKRTPDSNGNALKYKGSELSTKRARFVYKYLYFKGVNKNRMDYYGYGFQKPLHYPEKTNEEMRANKRVEIKIIKL